MSAEREQHDRLLRCKLAGPAELRFANGDSMPCTVTSFEVRPGPELRVGVLGKPIRHELEGQATVDLRAIWDDFVRERVQEQKPSGPSREPLTVVVEVERLRAHLEARGLRGFDLVVNEHGAVVIVPKIHKLGFVMTKVPE